MSPPGPFQPISAVQQYVRSQEEKPTWRGHRKSVEIEPEADIQQQLVQASTKCASARSTPLFTRCRLGPDSLICSPAASTTHRHGAGKALREEPNYLPAAAVASASHALAGRLEEARQAMARLRRIDPALRMSNS